MIPFYYYTKGLSNDWILDQIVEPAKKYDSIQNFGKG